MEHIATQKLLTQDPWAAPIPEQEIAGEVLIEKYAKDGEKTIQEVRRRVAAALAAVEPEARRDHWEQRFLEIGRAHV